MQGYWGKLFGIYISILALLFLLIFIFTDLLLFKTLDKTTYILCSIWLFSLGQFSMMMSKERVEDERVKKIRAKSMQMFIMALLTPMMTMGFFATIDSDFGGGLGNNLAFISLSLFLYNIYFNYSLKFDPQWNYNEGGSVDNFKTDKRSLVFLTILFLAVIIIYSIL